ncbi:MAG: hypothetical protein ACI4QX_10250 [Lachnospiraceae bacterium]
MAQQEGISAEELKELLERYRIGKKPLAALLGWGATTVLRYADGVCPAGEYAEHLKKIYEEPLYYLELLEEHKERLTPVAYKKSRNAVLLYLTSSKLWCGVQYLIGRTKADISPFRVVITLFYAQAFSLGLTDSALFWEECDLSGEGEVPYAEFYEQLKKCGVSYRFEEEGLLTPQEEHFINAAYEMLLWYGPAELKSVFLAERRYIRTSRTENGGRKIKNAALAAYFKKVVQGYNISRPEEFHKYFAERTGRKRKRGKRV